jgi:hypothetical protein
MSERRVTVAGCGDCPWHGQHGDHCTFSGRDVSAHVSTTPSWCPLRAGAVTVQLEEPKPLGQIGCELAALRELETAVRASGLQISELEGVALARLDAARRPTLGQVACEAYCMLVSRTKPLWDEYGAGARDAWERVAAAVVAEHERRKGAR